MKADALKLQDVSRHYGSLKAVDRVSLSVAAGSRHALIGPNGAGKSTLFGVIAGTIRTTSGTIVVHGSDVTKWDEHRRVRQGLARTLQHSSLFDGLSALDNVALAAQRQAGIGARFWRPSAAHRVVTAEAEQCLDRVGLANRAVDSAGSLSHGERRQLEVAVALATKPRVLLLDEPTAGMSAAESGDFVQLIMGLPADVTVIIVEHDLDVVFQLATRVSVLHVGRILAEGTPSEVRANTKVQEAYLGAAHTSDLFLDPLDHQVEASS